MPDTFKGKLFSLLSSMIDVNETYSLPSELGELLNLYIQKKSSSKSRSQFEYNMRQINSNLSKRYGAYEPIKYSEEDIISYVLYYFPINFPKIQYILYDLIRYGNPDILKKKEIKILDVGAGCGTIPISLSFFLKSIGGFEKLNVDIIESNELFIAAFQDLKEIINSKNFGVPICEGDHIIVGSFEDKDVCDEINGKYDIITFSNVLNETKLSIEELADWIIKYKNKLNESGHLIIIEPEDEPRAKRTTELRNVLLKRGIKDVYCTGENIWGIINENCDHWCVYKKLIKTPENEGFFLISTYNKGINFSYLNMNQKRYVLPQNPNYPKLNSLKIGTRVNICGKVIERNDYQKVTHLFICDGTQKVKIFAYKFKPDGVTPHPSHEKIETIKINDVVIFKQVYVKEDAKESGLQIEIDNSTETPRIIPYFE